MKNLGVAFLQELDESIDDYDGLCGELVDGMIHWLGQDRVDILYIEPADQWDALQNEFDSFGWRYHMAAIVDGLVHDPWFETLILPPKEYVRSAFFNQRVIATKNPGQHV